MKKSQKSDILKLLNFGDKKKWFFVQKVFTSHRSQTHKNTGNQGKIELITLHIDLSGVIVKK